MPVSSLPSSSNTQAPSQTTITQAEMHLIKQMLAIRSKMKEKPLSEQQAMYDYMMSMLFVEAESLVRFICFDTCSPPENPTKTKRSRNVGNKRTRMLEASATL